MPARPLGPLDNPAATAGDSDWRGVRSRAQVASLPPGIDRYAQNMRYNRREKQPRAGCRAVSTDLEIINPAIVLDFTLGADVPLASLTRAGATATATTTAAHGFITGNLVAIEGATQPEYNGDWAITVTGATTFTYNLGAATPATPATGTLTANRGPRLFDVYDNSTRAACVYTDTSGTERMLLAAGTEAWIVSAGAASIKIDYPAGENLLGLGDCDLVAAYGTVTLFRGASDGTSLTLASLTRAGTTVTATTTAAHGLTTGQWVRLTGQASADYAGVWQATVTGATTFTYDIGAATPASPAATPGAAIRVRPPLRWNRDPAADFVLVPTGGAPEPAHIRMPPADWALPFNGQLWLPTTTTELLGSDFFEPDVYDTTQLLRFRHGGPDWLVAAYPGPLTDEPGAMGPRLLVLMRKSLHLLYLSPTTLAIEAKKQIPAAESTGCRARRSLQTCGEFIVWLSDNGVQLARLGRELTLLTSSRPLSADIHDLIERINTTCAHRATAAYWNNRYYLAVPLDDSTVNNAVLVFNFLNTGPDAPFGEWEGHDIYPASFDIVAFLVLDYQGRQRLHAVSTTGFAYVLEIDDLDQYGAPGTPATLTQHEIPGLAHGRLHDFGSLETKRFSRARLDLRAPVATASATVTLHTMNPDADPAIGTWSPGAPGDATLALSPRRRAIAAAVDLSLPAGRPAIKTITLEATLAQTNTRARS